MSAPGDAPKPPAPPGAKRLAELEAHYDGPALVVEPKDRGGLDVVLNQPLVAAILAEEHLIFRDPALRTFFEYDEALGIWSPVTEEKLQHVVESLLLRLAKAAELPRVEAARLRTQRHVRDVIGWLKGAVEEQDAFQARLPIVHVANGVLRLEKSGYAFTGHHPSYYSRHVSPIAFKRGAACPGFDAFLQEALPDADDRELVQVMAGQWLLGRNLTQTILLLIGNAGTGKSTLLAILRGLVGPRNCTELRTAHLDGRFEMFHYLSKSLLIGSDVPGDFLSNTGAQALKKLTGEDLITVEKKFGESVEMLGSMNIGMTANARLRVKVNGDAGAWRRRLAIVEFTGAKPARPEPQLAKRLLEEEGSGILNWAVRGVAALMERLAEKKGLPLSPRHLQTVEDLLEASDSLAVFLRDGVEPVTDGSDVSSEELCAAYRSYCAGRGWEVMASVERHMRAAVESELGMAQSHDLKRAGRTCRGYRGIRVKGGSK